MPPEFQVLLQLCTAVLVGGLIGAEREFRDKAAGFRTNILITVGSAMFTILSMKMEPTAASRIASNVVTGIGFLGAGAIIHEHGRVGGLTTAATIWFSAAIGMAIGAGLWPLAMIGTAIILIVLMVFPHVEIWISKRRETRNYTIVVALEHVDHLERVDQAFKSCSLHIRERHRTKTPDSITSTWLVHGRPEQQEQFVEKMMRDDCIRELKY